MMCPPPILSIKPVILRPAEAGAWVPPEPASAPTSGPAQGPVTPTEWLLCEVLKGLGLGGELNYQEGWKGHSGAVLPNGLMSLSRQEQRHSRKPI